MRSSRRASSSSRSRRAGGEAHAGGLWNVGMVYSRRGLRPEALTSRTAVCERLDVEAVRVHRHADHVDGVVGDDAEREVVGRALDEDDVTGLA